MENTGTTNLFFLSAAFITVISKVSRTVAVATVNGATVFSSG